jgi:hypothetical protein
MSYFLVERSTMTTRCRSLSPWTQRPIVYVSVTRASPTHCCTLAFVALTA